VPPKLIMNEPTRTDDRGRLGAGSDYDHALSEAFSGRTTSGSARRRNSTDPPERGFETRDQKTMIIWASSDAKRGGARMDQDAGCAVATHAEYLKTAYESGSGKRLLPPIAPTRK